ncbi:MAG: 4Fe-4S dicluster domain-containing protein, partial [Bacteroidales bacterium]|nr:4Fe-4S dicluster domain-containing protein [Bacteroidales bacterium]
DSADHKIDYTRCVDCMDCIDTCRHGAIHYRWAYNGSACSRAACATLAGGEKNTKTTANTTKKDEKNIKTTHNTTLSGAEKTHQTISTESNNLSINTTTARDDAGNNVSDNASQPSGRRSFLTGAGLLVGGLVAAKLQEKAAGAQNAASDIAGALGDDVNNGGYAPIADKIAPQRITPIVPPGAHGLRHFSKRCTGCQLCVSVCPNGVLRPSTDLETLMQPRASYERGYCRPECTKCSEVCPAGAIVKIDTAEKTSIQIGHAVWIRENCIPVIESQTCGNCARHCPSGAITMVPLDPYAEGGRLMIPAVNTEKCIGCGACENLCPARPYSAIYVEGHEVHRII